MTFLYRIQAELDNGIVRTWYEEGNSAEVIHERVARTLHNCMVNAKVTVKLGS